MPAISVSSRVIVTESEKQACGGVREALAPLFLTLLDFWAVKIGILRNIEKISRSPLAMNEALQPQETANIKPTFYLRAR